MSGRGAGTLRFLSFGDSGGELWAAALDAGRPAMIVGGADSAAEAEIASWQADGAQWRLQGDRVSLTVSPVSVPRPAPVPAPDGQPPVALDDGPEPPWSGVQQLCRIRGTVSLGGEEREVDCVGARTELDQVKASELGSVRGFTAWFSDAEVVTLLALRRPAGAEHESDRVSATVFDPDRWLASSDPRMSTTYDGSGEPTRASLELWIADGEHEFPRRAAGEAAGPPAALSAGGCELKVRPLRCHSRGHEGAGVYVLAAF